jgi:large-conductance mechanosensitive channel
MIILDCLVAFVIISLSYYFLVVRVVNREIRRYKQWQKDTGMEEIIKQHEEDKKKKK